MPAARTKHHAALRETRCARARELGREKRTNRDADGHAHAADDLRGEEQAQRATLDRGEIECVPSRGPSLRDVGMKGREPASMDRANSAVLP